jgi:uncharacterized SAM-binding protein YcdF (DUF218 family)
MRRRSLVLAVATVLALGAAGSWCFLGAGNYLEGPRQAPAPADLIVALGGDNGDRVRVAARLHKAGYGKHVLLTGLEDAPSDTRRAYLNWRAAFLTDYGVPEDAIVYDYASSNSKDEAVNTKALMQQRAWKRVLVVSDPPHMRRLAWVWGGAFNGTDMEYRLVSSEPAWWEAAHWWRQDGSAKFVLFEYLKLAYYWVRGI